MQLEETEYERIYNFLMEDAGILLWKMSDSDKKLTEWIHYHSMYVSSSCSLAWKCKCPQACVSLAYLPLVYLHN